MEVIEIPGYSQEEKLGIARKFLIPRQLEEHGINDKHIKFTDPAIERVIAEYTREAGVRNLEREIANVMRKVVKKIAEGKEGLYAITPALIPKYLGVPKHENEGEEKKDLIGVAKGLAWTECGGDIIHIEATLMKGKGVLTLTGHLGDVMKESAHAALSYIRSRARQLKINPDSFARQDIHIHVPAGAIPKDGPSAGITMASALASAFTNTPLRHDIAMTGEVTLRGRVLQIGGLKEKILAAKRVGIYTVIMPDRNRKDLTDIPKHLLQGMTFVFADTMEEVLRAALRNRKLKENTDKAVGVSKPVKLLKRAPVRRPVAAIAGTVR
jgi:ATP-dependent Lon protease